MLRLHLCFLIGKILLHHSTNLAIGVEMLAYSSPLVQRTAYFLSGAAQCAVRCVMSALCGTCNSYVHYARTVELRTYGTILRKYAGAGTLCLVACRRLEE